MAKVHKAYFTFERTKPHSNTGRLFTSEVEKLKSAQAFREISPATCPNKIGVEPRDLDYKPRTQTTNSDTLPSWKDLLLDGTNLVVTLWNHVNLYNALLFLRVSKMFHQLLTE